MAQFFSGLYMKIQAGGSGGEALSVQQILIKVYLSIQLIICVMKKMYITSYICMGQVQKQPVKQNMKSVIQVMGMLI